jgi:hypothetical protein
MAEEQNQYKTISKKNAGFPDYLDFDKLRREGIEYLGQLSGKLWTDHNVHDPGITILEMLCYAMLDLGYRTNLPVSDILARHPEVTTADDNFLTPAQILTNNPLTITDYRKLLIDIPGVKNAWLEIEKEYDVEKFCDAGRQNDPCCTEYVNGLYRVILDLENSLYTDLSKNEFDEKKKNALLEKVTKTLLAHRNFCEDFMTISILCKLEIGVCADIELEENADPEQVYLKMAEALYQFFSPAPKFYTLPQLLEKGKTIDEIFAGRPNDIKESHGFLDVEELEQLPLRKEIHLSDVYNVLLAIPGVKRVQNLRLRKCSGNDFMNIESWKFLMPDKHVPEFSVKCSGFRFLRYGVPVAFNFQKYQPLIEMNAVQMGKVLYKTPSPYLDSEIPKGNYRGDLDQYYSIQNEFPRVYGISEGGLPDNAPAWRKAKALQLKGYLLFFDQLLANYLSQLKNLRSLFSMSAPANEAGRYSYFINELNTVPDLNKLLRFTSPETDVQGALLAFPVDLKMLLDKIEAGNMDELDVENIDHYLFGSLDKAMIAVSQLRDDFYHGNYTTHILTRCDDCVFYYILTSSDCFALIGRKYFKNTEEARLASESLQYVAGFEENYRTWIDASDNASFDIEFNLSDYKKYLQRIAEEPELYRERRQSFLDHLLARFAERFTDFALLSYDQYTQQQLQEKEIEAKEGYLASYPSLSANRGKAYNYQQNGWNNENISGFENKFMALSGIANRNRHSLCNFEVTRYNEKYVFTLNLSEQLYISSDEVFESKEEAREGIRKLLQSLKSEPAYDVQLRSEEQKHRIVIEYEPGKKAFLAEQFDSPEAAWKVAGNLRRMFTSEAADTDVIEDSYKFTPMLKDYDGNLILNYNQSAIDEGEAKNAALKSIGKTGDRKIWTPAEGREVPPLKLSYDPKANEIVFIDTDVFKKDINNTIVGKPDKYTYELLDKNNSFKFRSVNEFDNEKSAKDDYSRLLHLLVLENNFQVERKDDRGRYRLNIVDGDKVVAESYGDFDSEPSARSAKAEIRNIINKHLYRVEVDKQPATWKFNYSLGYKAAESFIFKSAAAYNSRAEALEAAKQFSGAAADIDLQREGKKISLRTNRTIVEFTGDEQEAEKIEPRLSSLVAVQKDITALLERSTAATLDRFIKPDDISKLGLYVYRLVDKDKKYAFSQQSGADKAKMEAVRDELIKTKGNNYNALDLYIKGEIVNERKSTDNKSSWYHYQLRSVNAINRPDSTSGDSKPLVLFESTKGYESREDAQKAFAENYFKILRLGMDIDNYRSKKILSSELLIHNTLPASEQDAIAFIPRETLKFLGEYEEKAWLSLIKVVKSYPLRTIYPKADCREFQARFNKCAPEPCDVKNDCSKTKEKPVWYFVIYNKEADSEVWQSEKYYTTSAEAWSAFEFFLILLKYHGNYYIDCSCAQVFNQRLNIFITESVYRIYIREVLAESAGRFPTEAEAWGGSGLQRFIDVSQAADSFHTYLNKKNCCFSFYVACANTKIYHPCKYDTPEQRDRAAILLFHSLEKTPLLTFLPQCRDKASLTLRDFDGKNLATVSYEQPDAGIDEPTYFGWYTEILKRIATYGLCTEDNKLYLKGKSILFTPMAGNNEAIVKELKERLQWMAQYYPITSRVSGAGQNKRIKYCIEIKLPEFNSNTLVDDCSGKTNCWVAWKSDCCYQTCEEIVQALRQAILLLSRFSNYKPVFDCNCHSYGIAIHYENMLPGDQCGYIGENQQQVDLPCDNAILAYNPQCYTSAKMACAAADRARLLINSEGLHVVEHILLRPHCPEDCDCRLRPCPNEFDNCDFPSWKRPTGDPCDEELPVCFSPGHDPYSFIATVVLPAWPKRFRSKDNRLQLENILYREAPAHVLLRIIWLAPHDFCCFEKQYKEWIKALGLKRSCSEFSLCQFTQFLFSRQFECLGEPRVCEPCPDLETIPNPCLTTRQLPQRSLSERLLSQVNTAYCWLDQSCNQYRFVPCEEIIQQPPPIERPNVRREEPGLDIASKAKFINSRFARYRKETDEIVTETKGAKPATMVRRFLDNNEPTAAEYKKLAEEILTARDDKKSKTITKRRAEVLLSMATQYFIDKWAFNGKDIKKLKQSSAVFENMRAHKIDMLEIYRKWESDALKKYEPGIDMNQVKYLLTGNK